MSILSNIIIYIMIIFMAIFGGLSTIYLVVSIPSILIWKIYRKVKFGDKIM